MSSNASLCGADPSELVAAFSLTYVCMTLRVGRINMAAFAAASLVLVVPACVSVLHLGRRRRRRRRRPVAQVSHADFFTYVTAVTHLLKFLVTLVSCGGAFACDVAALNAAILSYTVAFSGEMGLHMLTCVDRHLAAVHPVAYLRLKTRRGARMRNAAAGGVALLAVGGAVAQAALDFYEALLGYACYVAAAIAVISFCSVSVLRVLIGPRPGGGGGAGTAADQSKRRAFCTITAILAVLLVKFGGNMAAAAAFRFADLPLGAKCGLWLSELWLSLPCSLVLPLLFLLRWSASRRPRGG